MSWQDKDEQDAGLNRGLPKWVLIVGVVIALIIVGAIVKNCRGNKGSGSSRSTTLDKPNAPSDKIATLNGFDPVSKTTINPINGFDSASGNKKVCSYSSGQSVKVLDSSGGRTKVDGGGCIGWLSSDFVK